MAGVYSHFTLRFVPTWVGIIDVILSFCTAKWNVGAAVLSYVEDRLRADDADISRPLSNGHHTADSEVFDDLAVQSGM